MIKINLLGIARPTAARAPSAPLSAVQQALIFVGAAVVAFAVVGFFYTYWSRQITALEQRLKKAKAEQARLAAIQAENQRYNQRLKELEDRINTIQMLQQSRLGPVDLMTALANTVNRTSDLYLLTAGMEGNRLAIRGQANSVESIANFISALKEAKGFSDVQLRQYYQDDQHNRTTYKFNIDCAYTVAPAAVPAGAAAAPAPPPAAARRAGM
jgi:Tfp pilus assembly protein PilN